MGPLDRARACERIDAARLRELRDLTADTEPEMVAELVETFARDTAARLAELQHGVASRDVPRVVAVTHTLKGSCLTVGASRMAVLCGELHMLSRRGSLEGTPVLLTALIEESGATLAELRDHVG